MVLVSQKAVWLLCVRGMSWCLENARMLGCGCSQRFRMLSKGVLSSSRGIWRDMSVLPTSPTRCTGSPSRGALSSRSWSSVSPATFFSPSLTLALVTFHALCFNPTYVWMPVISWLCLLIIGPFWSSCDCYIRFGIFSELFFWICHRFRLTIQDSVIALVACKDGLCFLLLSC